jgi:hypothetical protein
LPVPCYPGKPLSERDTQFRREGEKPDLVHAFG